MASSIITIGTTTVPATGIAIPATARPVPFSCPLLLLILTRPTMPQIRAGRAVSIKVNRPIIASTNDHIAKALVLTPVCGASDKTGKGWLQDKHTFAFSGFCVPHFGQYVLFSFRANLHYCNNNTLIGRHCQNNSLRNWKPNDVEGILGIVLKKNYGFGRFIGSTGENI